MKKNCPPPASALLRCCLAGVILLFLIAAVYNQADSSAETQKYANAVSASAGVVEQTEQDIYSGTGYQTWQSEKLGKHQFGFKRFLGLIGIVFVMFSVLVYDVASYKKRAGRDEKARGAVDLLAGTPAMRSAFDLIFAAFVILILISKLKDSPWEMSDPAGYQFYPGAIKGVFGYFSYVMGDIGLPALPYRALLPLLAIPKSMALARCFAFAMALGTLGATYILARRHIRPQLAWIAPVLLFGYRIFNYGLEDLRGYMLFTFCVVLSVCAFESAIRQPRPGVLFLWTAAHFIAFMSNPLTVSIAAGPAFYYLFAARKTLATEDRRIVDFHFAAIAAGAVCFFPFIYRTVGFSVHLVQYPRIPYIVFRFLSYFNAFWLVCAVIFLAAAAHFRKDFRGALFMSASAGTAATLLMFALEILGPYERYFLFVMPLNFVCIGILAETCLRGLETRGSRAAGVAATVVAVIFIAAAGLRWTEKAFLETGNHAKLIRAITLIDKRVSAKKEPGEPVYIFPYDFFYFYFMDANKLNIYERNPITRDEFGITYRWRNLPSGDVLLTTRNLFSTAQFFANPNEIFNVPYWAVVSIQKGEKDPFESIKTDCDVSEFYSDIGLIIKHCKPAGRRK
ncbi:MAG: hypothetical protein WCX65_08115 [bacterium]